MTEQNDQISIQTPCEQKEKECIACHKNIHPEAGLCPFCRTPQSRSIWQFIIDGLKWIGGITAIITMVVSSVNLNDIVTSSKRRSTTVEQLVNGADRMHKMGTIDSAFSLLSEALTVDPTSKEALELQVEFAMEKVREITKSSYKKNVQNIESMFPIIERGAGESDNRKTADALAHIGWINYLRSAAHGNQYKSDIYFQEAFEFDPDNYYAHLLRAKWCLANDRREKIDNPFEQAMKHYRELEKSSGKNNGLDKMIWQSLLTTRDDTADFAVLERANEYRKQGKQIDREIKKALMYFCCKAFSNEEKIKKYIHNIPPQELKEIFTWIQDNNTIDHNEKMDCSGEFTGRYISILLDDISGDTATSLAHYRTLLGDIRKKESATAYHYREKSKIARKLGKFLNIRPAAIGVTGKSLYGKAFEKLTQKWCCGLQVKDIVPSGPADLAGIKYNDIITAVNGQIPRGSFSRLIGAIGIPGEELNVTLLRNGDTLRISCQPEAMDDSETKEFFTIMEDDDSYSLVLLDRYLYPSGLTNEPRLKARITDLTDMACTDFSISQGTQGVLVLSATHRYHKLVAGDVISNIAGVSITTLKDLLKGIQQAVANKEIAIKINVLREGKIIPILFPLYETD